MSQMKDGKGQVKYQEVANASVLQLQWVVGGVGWEGAATGFPYSSAAEKELRTEPWNSISIKALLVMATEVVWIGNKRQIKLNVNKQGLETTFTCRVQIEFFNSST